MEVKPYKLIDIFENYDYLRKPLSSMERESFQGDYPYYGAQGVIDHVQDYICDGEYMLIAEDGENLMSRNQPIAVIVDGKFWVNNHAHIVKTNNLASMKYICYLLNSSDITGFITGSAQPKLSQANLNKIKVLLPSIEYQEQVASILSTYDNLIEVNNKRIKVLEQMAENLYKEWFVRFRFPGHESVPFENGLPKGWKIKRVDAIGEVIGGGTPSTNVDSFWNGTIPWLTPADLSNTNRILIRRGSTNISSEGLKRSGATMMPPATVLVSSRAPVGYLAIAANPICTNQGFKSIVCFEGKTSPYYLFFFLRSNREMLQNYATGATFPELSGNRMKKIKILVPDYQIQHRFETIAKEIICEMDKLEEANDLLKHQRDLLLPRLMSGKLEV